MDRKPHFAHAPGPLKVEAETNLALLDNSQRQLSFCEPENQKHSMISHQQWENLRPIIKRLYVDENRTMKNTSKHLGENHGFEPTKRQLLRKITEWGFEKNVKRQERQAIVTRQQQGRPVGETIRGRKLDKAKIKRWKKRDGIDSAQKVLHHDTRGINLQTTASQNVSSNKSSRLNQAASTTGFWSIVDVPGSPKLTKLIGALTCFVDACSVPFLDISGVASNDGYWGPTNRITSVEDVVDPEDGDQAPRFIEDVVVQAQAAQGSNFETRMSSSSKEESLNFSETLPFLELSAFPGSHSAETHLVLVKSTCLTEIECKLDFEK